MGGDSDLGCSSVGFFASPCHRCCVRQEEAKSRRSLQRCEGAGPGTLVLHALRLELSIPLVTLRNQSAGDQVLPRQVACQARLAVLGAEKIIGSYSP
jgi:hypothetical protein